ncbi:hypothetical protein DFJ73DRAFT_334898 [Zopfochytrium polystomum]|nr:hypothetical protein DFJ73DRAFT_334898 [Zopfochytrium polystomum]
MNRQRYPHDYDGSYSIQQEQRNPQNQQNDHVSSLQQACDCPPPSVRPESYPRPQFQAPLEEQPLLHKHQPLHHQAHFQLPMQQHVQSHQQPLSCAALPPYPVKLEPLAVTPAPAVQNRPRTSLSPSSVAPQKPVASSSKSSASHVCANCSATSTPLWRRGPKGEVICNACGLYMKARNTYRPTWLKKKRTGVSALKRDDAIEKQLSLPSANGTASLPAQHFANQPLSVEPISTNAPGPVLAPKVPEVRPPFPTPAQTASGPCLPQELIPAEGGPAGVSEEPAGQAASGRDQMSCTNCGTTATPLWRRNEKGMPICNACGLYFKLHGERRPVTMQRAVIRRRKRVVAPQKSEQLAVAPDLAGHNISFPAVEIMPASPSVPSQQLAAAPLPQSGPRFIPPAPGTQQILPAVASSPVRGTAALTVECSPTPGQSAPMQFPGGKSREEILAELNELIASRERLLSGGSPVLEPSRFHPYERPPVPTGPFAPAHVRRSPGAATAMGRSGMPSPAVSSHSRTVSPHLPPPQTAPVVPPPRQQPAPGFRLPSIRNLIDVTEGTVHQTPLPTSPHSGYGQLPHPHYSAATYTGHPHPPPPHGPLPFDNGSASPSQNMGQLSPALSSVTSSPSLHGGSNVGYNSPASGGRSHCNLMTLAAISSAFRE